MKSFPLVLLLILLTAACGVSGDAQVPVAELPNPSIYAVGPSDLPEVGLAWTQTYNQTTSEPANGEVSTSGQAKGAISTSGQAKGAISASGEGYKWSYLAYQAYQPGNTASDLASAFAVNNDVVLYEVNVSRQNLPQPPTALGDLQGISWTSVAQTHRLGDKSAVWKTTLGDLYTPVWWLEFYQGHAYVRISLLGFPDQIAPSILYGLGDLVAGRLPRSSDKLRLDATAGMPSPSPVPTVSK